MKLSIGDKVQVTAIGKIIGMKSGASGETVYEVLNLDTVSHCFVTEQSLISMHTETVREEERDAVTKAGK